ncbi:hypothetical protein AQUCO_05900003v1 [Aquilegia coerulea]|uniref:ZZ-type domain-containing protein n=1 Tax=Aquilegia coerulea TaxID=218851 RepID=A0A2G5CF71_AQUCA|nr:hypothetical protein AQUCO_05900003v1 [Aquilegia coerulea]
MLEQLNITSCPILVERFRKGDVSSSSSPIYNISIWSEQQTLIGRRTRREKSFQSDVNVHIGIRCDNCEINPIVGKRYKCKDCWEEHTRPEHGVGFDICEECYHTRSNHPDLVNQHHTLGHTFELIANRGDSSVPVHPDDT